MSMQELTAFFMWCTILNGGLLLFWAFLGMLAPELVYQLHSKWFPMPRETFNVVLYAFLGAFKLIVLFFNVVPWLALLLMGG